MKRRIAAAVCGLVLGLTLVAGAAAPASAAGPQDFYLVNNNGVRVAVAQGILANGTGTFVPAGPNAETILIGGSSPIFMSRSVTTHTERLDPRTCRAVVQETGTFEFSQRVPGATFGGSGTYTLAGVRVGQRFPFGGCFFSSPDLTQSALNASSVEVHGVPDPPPPPTG